eukprot:scaffold2684_cov124-Isochrysis_galbana.AAC.7
MWWPALIVLESPDQLEDLVAAQVDVLARVDGEDPYVTVGAHDQLLPPRVPTQAIEWTALLPAHLHAVAGLLASGTLSVEDLALGGPDHNKSIDRA